MSEPWYIIRLTYADATSNQLLTLGGSGWKSRRHQAKAWAELPQDYPGSPFVADLIVDGDLVGDIPVSRQTIEALTGRPIAELIAEARLEAEQERTELAGRRVEK